MDGTDLIEADEADLLSEAAVTRLRRHPRLWEACEYYAAGILAEHACQDAATRWLFKDLGRASLYLGSALLDSMPGGLTVAGLVEMAAQRGVCSRGRVLAFVHVALDTSRYILPPGDEPWIRRRLILTPAFIAPIRANLQTTVEATAIVAPEIAQILPRLASDALVQQTAVTLAMLLAMRPELVANQGGPFREIFVAREGGMRILQHLMLRQPRGRSRFLEAAPLSRAELARNHGVSRTHVNRLLAEAEAAGAVSFDGPNRVVFSPALSDETEAYIAGMLQVNRVVIQSLPPA
jgi:hypothetical protein